MKQLTMSAYEAAEVLGVVPATMYLWIRNGEMPSIRLGGRIRVPTAKLAEMLGIDFDTLVGQLSDPAEEGQC